jgi:peptidoglycan/LPS O-acetylase OafA/YrhL
MYTKQHITPTYRADIDGLRAIAVMLVVLDHLEFRGFGGGYVGVDVFFVISGYLIGSSLISDFNRNVFSLAAFYERRVRRIFPALLAMLIVTTGLAYHYLLPNALMDYARSALAALGSFSNFLFWHQAGYFDLPSVNKPLLHTWSLGVEEQFYLLFPILLFAVFRWFPLRLKPVLWTLSALTLGLSIWFVHANATTAFFWSPLRAWELLLGVLTGQYAWNVLRARWVREAVAAVGLCMILLAGFAYNGSTPFPGGAALLPCVGTACVIAAGQVGTSGAAKLLSIRPLTFIGLISYSLYLWHWPIAVFQRTSFLLISRPLWETRTKLLALAVSLVVATLSWALIETPFRKGSYRPTRKPLFAVTGAVTFLVAATMVFMVRADGFPKRFPDEVIWLEGFKSMKIGVPPYRFNNCFIDPDVPGKYNPSECLTPEPSKKNYLLYGDSVAAHLYPGLVKSFPEIHFEQAAGAGCFPYQDHSDVQGKYRENCAALWSYIHTTYLPANKPDAVIIASSWIDSSLPNIDSEIGAFQKRGIPVILVGPEINFDVPMPFLIAIEIHRHSSRQQAISNISKHLNFGKIRLDGVMRERAAERWHVRYISYFQELCPKPAEGAPEMQWETSNGCPLFVPSGQPLLFDTHHFTVDASIYFASRLRSDGVLP